MASTLAELLVKIGVDADDLESGTKSAVDSFEADIGKLGLAAGAGAAGLEGLARKTGETGVSIGNLAGQLGMSESSIRDMATEMSNATFPMEDVLGLMETGAQRGLESEAALTQYAENWDMIGDATGGSGPELAKAGVALEALGISAGEEGQALDAFGFIMNDTSQDVDDFIKFIERTGPELNDMGLDVDDTAALLGLMESELGLTGRTARQEFRSALSDSDGTLEGMLDTLGLSEDQFNSMRDEVEGSGGAIEDNAERLAESMTPIQEMQSRFEDLMVTLSPFSGAIANAAIALGAVAAVILTLKAGLMAYQTVMAAVKVATVIWTGVQWLLNSALLANPITWIILLIIALIAIIVLIILNWDKVAAATAAAWDWIVAALAAAWGWIKAKAASVWGSIVDFFAGIVNGIIGFFAMLGRIPGMVAGFFGRMKDRAIAQAVAFLQYVAGIPGRVRAFFGNAGSWLINAGANLIRGLINGVTNMLGSLRERFSSVTSMIPSWKGPESVDLRLLEGPGEDIMTGLERGIEGGLPGLRDTLRGVTDTIPSGVSASVQHSGMAEQRVVIDVTGGDDDLVNLIRKWIRENGGGDPGALGTGG